MASDPPRPEPSSATPVAATVHGWLRLAASRLCRPQPGWLDLGEAIDNGWRAFVRAPRVFAAFALVVNLLLLALQPLLMGIGSRDDPSDDPRAWLLFGVALSAVVALHLWGQLSLVRAARLALEGGRPTLAELLRVDRDASLRLLRAWLRLASLVLALPIAAALMGFVLLLLLGLPSLQRLLGLEATHLLALALVALVLVLLALSLTALLYLAVNQAFLPQIVLFEGGDGDGALQRGRRLVDPQWPLVLLLVIISLALHGLGWLLCVVGSLVTWPLATCISTAAYLQLRQGEQRRQALATSPAGGEADEAGP